MLQRPARVRMSFSVVTGIGRSPGSIRAGLLWLLVGNRLIALSENTAMIETPIAGTCVA